MAEYILPYTAEEIEEKLESIDELTMNVNQMTTNINAIGNDVDELSNNVSSMRTDIIKAVYPVGAIYMSVSSTSPATLFGGTWEQIKDRFLLSAGSSYSAGATGGSATHTLTINEIPAHAHHIKNYKGSAVWASGYLWSRAASDGGNTEDGQQSWTDNQGGGAAHNNMPPYLAVYMWKRTA